MPSFKIATTKRRRKFVRLMGKVHEELVKAYNEEHARRGLTKTDIAELIGRDKGSVTRWLSGTHNMTLETLADLSFALERDFHISLPSEVDEVFHGANVSSGTNATVINEKSAPRTESASTPFYLVRAAT